MRFLVTATLLCMVLAGCNFAEPCTSPGFDGHVYQVVEIGEQCWFAENLRSQHYANGDPIPYPRSDESWMTQEGGNRCFYADDSASLQLYGQLYNGLAVLDSRGLCPSGWHVPSDEDWQQLEKHGGMPQAEAALEGYRGMELGLGTMLKSKQGWSNQSNGTDALRFRALPGGDRFANRSNVPFAGDFGYWWSSSFTGDRMWLRTLSSQNPGIKRGSANLRYGFSVRCIQNAQ